MSSEALARAEVIEDALAGLLAEVARLEQERDEARKWANTMEHERDWETQVVHSELLGRAESSGAALAVAREREQRATDGCEKAAETFAELAEALTLLRHPTLAAACRIAEAGTRAALVDEPAAGPQTVLGDDRDAVVSRSEIRDAVHPGVAWSSTPDPAAATLAEPEVPRDAE